MTIALNILAQYDKTKSTYVVAAFRELLEKKHLYQTVSVSDQAIMEHFGRLYPVGTAAKFASDLIAASGTPWELFGGSPMPRTVGSSVAFNPPDVKLFCTTCDRREAFNSIFSARAVNSDNYPKAQGPEEVFVLTYLCQSCKRYPEVFLVRRLREKLTLSGRTPMESAEVPAEIPKQIQKFYRDAVVAHQSGQTLAALFLFRVACEQWSRLWALPIDRADKAVEKYMDSLPQDFKARFPSISALYAQLSADIHAATGSTELFDSAADTLSEHFKARALYKLQTPK